MRLSRLLRSAAGMSYGPPSAASPQLLASRDAPHRRLLLCANSTVFQGSYLGHCGDVVAEFLAGAGAKKVLFVPWALKDWDKYFANPAAKLEYDAAGQPLDHTGRPQARLKELGFESSSIHHAPCPLAAVREAQALFVGGGNGFRLLKELYKHEGLVPLIRQRVLSGELAFIGSSAGTNAAGQGLHVSICMPICAPPTFDALGLLPCLISPHYHGPENKAFLAAHGQYVGMEENRDQRIAQYFEERDAGGHPLPVLGLREGGLLRVLGNTATLHGLRGARVFSPPDGGTADYEVGADVSAAIGL